MKPDPIEKAIDLVARGGIVRESSTNPLAPKHPVYYVPCGGSCGSEHHKHTVSMVGDVVKCDCPARATCYHILCTFGLPVAVLSIQCRWASDQEELELVIAHHTPAIAGLPESLKAIARVEIRAARERLAVPLAA
jgi:hypothetical protein